jgi:hypothetical protein
MARDTLGPFQYQILSLLLRHPRDSYGATLLERIAPKPRGASRA